MNKIIKLTAALFLILSASSCEKYLEIEPVGKVIPTTAEDFRALLNKGYSGFPRHKSMLALRTDEVVLNMAKSEAPNYKDQYKWNDGTPDPASAELPYGTFYNTIFYANSVIADVEDRAGKTPETAQIKGEAYLLRAYSHFELLNTFAKAFDKNTAATDRGVPISVKIDLEIDYKPATIAAVYDQIFADLAAGQALVNVTDFPAGLNYRFTKRAALALAARIYEFRSEWSNALKASQDALALGSGLEDLNASKILLPNNYSSVESIMAMEDTFNSTATSINFISPKLLGMYNQVEDKRFALYFGKSGNTSNYVSKKGNSAALKISFRNAELYLIQAEAALQTDNMTLALKSVLDLKAKRLSPAYFATEQTRISGLDKTGLYQEILNERERELALEGHRWYDLKRYGQPELKHVLEGVTYTLEKNDPRYTIRFPQSAINTNPNLQ